MLCSKKAKPQAKWGTWGYKPLLDTQGKGRWVKPWAKVPGVNINQKVIL
jgi:hypothetical protein